MNNRSVLSTFDTGDLFTILDFVSGDLFKIKNQVSLNS